MEYILNKLPVKTTNNFKVNDLKIDLEIPDIKNRSGFVIDNNKLDITQEVINKKMVSKIGLEFSKFLNINITIPKNTKIDESIILEYDFNDDDSLVDMLNINYEENSLCNLVIIYKSNDNGNHFHHLLSKIKGGTNSRGNITYINLLNDVSNNFVAIENDLLDNSFITNNVIDIGANLKVNNIYSDTYKEATSCLNNIYLGFRENIIDMNYYMNNIGENSKNIMRVEGAIDDNTKKVFRGTIDFKGGCKGSIGDENENCVLLSDNVISRSLPQMLCHEEDVVGSHGVSSGKVDEDKLFYIMTHGYSKKEAEKLIVMANFSKILNNINDKEIREEIISIIEEKI